MNIRKITYIAMIAAIYSVLCLIPGLSALAFGPIQVRFAEALTMLPLIYKPSIWGVALGCFLSNLIGAATGVNPTGYLDAIIGTTATLLAAYMTWKLRDRKTGNVPVLSMLMPVIFNFFFIGLELAYLFMPENILAGTLINGNYVAIGEIIAVILGWLLVCELKKTSLFREE